MRGGLQPGYAIAAATEIVAGQKRIQLFPMGRHMGRDGRGPYILKDKAHGERVIAATRQWLGSCDLMIDYDHQVVADAEKAGSQAKAAGWIKPDTLTVEDDGIWGTVEWTPAGQKALDEREYRYVSPFFNHLKNGELTRFINAALVNIPNLELAAAAALSLGDIENMKAIATALGLAEDADEAAILAAIKTATTAAASTSTAAIATALALPETATEAEIVTAATAAVAAAGAAGEPDPAKFVPIGELQEVRSQLDGLLAKDAESVVDAAIAARKLTPANRDWGLKSYRADPAAFAAAMGNQPAVLAPGESESARGKVKVEALNGDQKALCASMGWDEAAYLAQLQADTNEENDQ